MATPVPAYLIAGVAFACAGVLAAGPIVAPVTGTWRAAAAPGDDDAAPPAVKVPQSTVSAQTVMVRDKPDATQTQNDARRTASGAQAQAIGDAMRDLEAAGL